LARRGATVYVSGRSVAGGTTTNGVPGTIDDTAREVADRGGRGIAVRCDHTVDADVESLFSRIREDHGRLDVLVNNVWGGYEHSECRPLPMVPFWQQSLHQWDAMFTAGVRAHLTASRLAVPLMLPQRRGLIVSTTANLEPLPYMPNLFYDLAKNAVARLVWAMAQELRPHGVAALALAPGFMRTERVVEAFRRAGAAAALNGPGGPKETPAYIGRAIVALASDERVIEKSGQLVEAGTLAHEYGFTDVDGTRPSPFRIAREHGTMKNDLDRLLERARLQLTRLKPQDVSAAVQKGAVVVDIRPEFQRRRDGEIPGAVIVERNHLEWRLHPSSSGRIAEAVDPGIHWIVICDEGYASSLAAATLQTIGLSRATDVAGGFQAWRAARLPVNAPGPVTPPRLAPVLVEENGAS
jgi:NAD(P)-dependent dehydrogenase (short-subunit alcohol dehydrogenase family)/rhodanese-related sulfurtransferase